MTFLRILIFSCIVLANDVLSGEKFSLPRTKVVEIMDSKTERVYELHIQRPKKYSKNVRYPVVYMTDSLYTFPIVVGASRYPINFAKMEDLIFVGISWQKGHHGGLSRQRDYTPTTNYPAYKDPSGKAHEHLNFIKNDVIKYVESKYSTDPDKRTYIGNSFGGLFGAYILLNSPTTFKHYILGSPSMWWDNEFMLKQNYKFSPSYEGKVFISVGADETKNSKSTKHDMVAGAKSLYAILAANKSKSMDIELRVIAHANHETAFPTVAIQGLWWLFETDK